MKNKLLIAASLLYTFISSCSNNENKITIIGENSSTIQSMQTLKSDYEKKSSVKLDFKPNTFEDAFNKANQDFANKTGLYDIVLQYNFSLSSFVRNNYVFNLNELKSQSDSKDYNLL
jgi:maltose-binding protein MalE